MRNTSVEYRECAQSANRYPVAKLEWADPILRWEEFYSTPLGGTSVPFGAAHSAALANDGAVWQAVADNGVLTVYRTASPTTQSGWAARAVVYTRNTGNIRSRPHIEADGPNGVRVITAELSGGQSRYVDLRLNPGGLVSQTTGTITQADAYAFFGGGYFCYATKSSAGTNQVIRVVLTSTNSPYTVYDDRVTVAGSLGFAPPNPLYVYGAYASPTVIYPGTGLVPYSCVVGAAPEMQGHPIIPTDPYDQWYRMDVWSATNIGGQIWAVARVRRRGSSGLYPLEFDAILRSADNYHWSLDRYCFICLYDNGGTLLVIGDYIYYVGRKVYRAPKNVLCDGSGWREAELFSWSIDTGEIWNASALTTEVSQATADAIPAGAWARFSCGYKDQRGNHLVQTGIYGVDAIVTSQEPGVSRGRLQGRDLGMRLLYDHAFDFDAVYESCPIGFTDGSSLAPLYPVWGVGGKQTTSTSTAGAIEFQGWNRVGLFFSATPLSTTRPQVEATFLYTTSHPSGVPIGLNVFARGKIARPTMTWESNSVVYGSGIADTYGLGGSPRTTGDWSLYGITLGTRIGFLRGRHNNDPNRAVVSRDLKGELIGAAETGRDCGTTGTVWRIGLDGKPLPPFYGFGVVLYAADEYNWVAVGLDLVARRIVTVACVGAETERGTIYGWHLIDATQLPSTGNPIAQNYAYRIAAVGSDSGQIRAQITAVNPTTGQIVWTDSGHSQWQYTVTVPMTFVCNGKTGIILCQPVAETIVENLPSDTDLAVRAWGLWGSTTNALINNNGKPQDDYADFIVSSGQQQVWRVVIDDGSGEPEICALNAITASNRKSCYFHSYAKNRGYPPPGPYPYEKRWFAMVPGNKDSYGGFERLEASPKCLYILNGIGVGLYGLVDDVSDMSIPAHSGGTYNTIGFRFTDAGAVWNDGVRWMLFERIGPISHRVDSSSWSYYIYESSGNFAEAALMPVLRLYDISNTRPRHHTASVRTHYGQSRVLQHYDEKLYVCDFTAAALDQPLYNLDFVVRDILAKAGVLSPVGRTIFSTTLTTTEKSIEPGTQLVGNITLEFQGQLNTNGKIVVKHAGRNLSLEILNSGSGWMKCWLYDLSGNMLDYHVFYYGHWWSSQGNLRIYVAFVDRFVFVWVPIPNAVRVMRACRVIETAADSTFSSGKGALTARITGTSSSISVTVRELYHPVTVATITSGQNAISVLRDAIQDLRLSLWPDSNGSVKYSLLDYPTFTFRDNLGTVSDSRLSGATRVATFGIERVRTDRVPTMVQTVGIETTNYLDEAAARQYGLLFMQTSVPSLTEDAAIIEGQRVVKSAVAHARPISLTMAAQPHWEIEDIVSVHETGRTYVVDRITMSGAPGRFEGTAYLRERVT